MWDVKEPMALFEKSRACSRCHGLADLCRHWSGRVGWDHLWTEAAARGAFYMLMSDLTLWFLRNSATGCKWGKVAPIRFVFLGGLLITYLCLWWENIVINARKINNYTQYRNMKRFDAKLFKETLMQTPWDSVFIFDDTDDLLDSWEKLFIDALEQHFPWRN